MRILILSINYWPEETGIGAFTTYRAEYLASVGHEVTVCTAFPYYPDWRPHPHYTGKVWADEHRNGVRILRGYIYIPNPVTAIKRVMHEASFIASCLMRAAGTKRPDVILTVSPPLGLALSAIFLSKLWKTPYVFDVEDLQPDAASAMDMLPSWVLKLMYRVEHLAYRHATLVSTITKGMRDRIIEKGIPAEKVVLFEPRVDDSLADISAEEGTSFRQRYGLGDKFLATHSGNIGVKQGIDVILDTAALTRDDANMVFLIVGNGAVRDKLERRARELNLQNVLFMPLLDSQEFRGLLSASDICLVTQLKTVSDIVFPSKTVTYLGAGCPVVASVNRDSEVARVVRESGAGTVVEPEQPEALRAAIYALKEDDLTQRRKRARDFAFRRWSAARVLGNLEAALVSVGEPAVPALAGKQIGRG